MKRTENRFIVKWTSLYLGAELARFALNHVKRDDAALPWWPLCMSLMIDWVFWMVQWQRALRRCHNERKRFTLLIPDRAGKTARREVENRKECKTPRTIFDWRDNKDLYLFPGSFCTVKCWMLIRNCTMINTCKPTLCLKFTTQRGIRSCLIRVPKTDFCSICSLVGVSFTKCMRVFARLLPLLRMCD